jgi:putative MATE family efflux protein
VQRSLTQGSIPLVLFKFSLPILFANILQSLNGSVNSIWVGRYLGEAALTATSNANTVMFLLIGAAFGVALAATILIGQYIGANNLVETKRVVGTSATFFAAISITMAITGLIFSRPLLIAMSTPPDSLALAVAYMRVIFLALPFLYMYAFVMAVLRGSGDSKTPFYFMLLSVGIDIALNPVFIFGLGPIPRLGIAGSALATFVAQAVSLTALIRHLYRRKHVLCLHQDELAYLKVNWSIVGTLVKKGIPMSAQMLVVSLSAVLMITLVNRFGVDTTAAFGAAMQIWNYIQMPAFAVGMGISAMSAQNVGAGKWERLTRIAGVGVLYSVLLTGSIVLLIELLNTHVFGLFLPVGSDALRIASHLNRIVTGSFIFFGISVALFGVVRATGAVIAPLIVLTISLLVVRFPLAEFFLDKYQADAIWWSFPISSVLSSILAFLYYRFGGWRSAHMLPVPASGGARASPEIRIRSGATLGAESAPLKIAGELPMQTRKLGRDGPRVSALGLGCMGMSEFYGAHDDTESLATLKHALDVGVNFLDTADMYGPYTNEELVGRALRGRRNDAFLATKFGFVRDVANPNARVIDGRPEHVREACEASLKRLQVEQIDLYYLHRVDPNVPIEETVGAMAQLVKSGKVRYLGLSEVSPQTLERAHRVHPITALQSEYSLWTRDPEDGVLAMCAELGVGFVPYSPLGRGFLTGALRTATDFSPDDFRRLSPRFQGENFGRNLALVEKVKTLAHDKGCTPAQLALAWMLAQGDYLVPIPGTRRIRNLDENLGALKVQLTGVDLATIEAVFPVGVTAGARYVESMMRLVRA